MRMMSYSRIYLQQNLFSEFSTVANCWSINGWKTRDRISHRTVYSERGSDNRNKDAEEEVEAGNGHSLEDALDRDIDVEDYVNIETEVE